MPLWLKKFVIKSDIANWYNRELKQVQYFAYLFSLGYEIYFTLTLVSKKYVYDFF